MYYEGVFCPVFKLRQFIFPIGFGVLNLTVLQLVGKDNNSKTTHISIVITTLENPSLMEYKLKGGGGYFL